MNQGKSFSIKTGLLDQLLLNWRNEDKRVQQAVQSKMREAINIVYKTARARRAMITNSRGKRVSSPNAPFGVPVRTGKLQESIQKNIYISGKKVVGSVYVDGSVDYAEFVEWGTSRMAARPFMGPALHLNKELIKKIFGKPIAATKTTPGPMERFKTEPPELTTRNPKGQS